MRAPDPGELRCHCGGALHAATSESMNVSDIIGLRVRSTHGGVPVLRCRRCGDEAIDGNALDAIHHAVAWLVCEGEPRLAADEARFLRKYLGLTQEKLAERMDLHRVTIAEWERGENPISSAHDFILRGLALSYLQTHAPLPMQAKIKVAAALEAVRKKAPPKRHTIDLDPALLSA